MHLTDFIDISFVASTLAVTLATGLAVYLINFYINLYRYPRGPLPLPLIGNVLEFTINKCLQKTIPKVKFGIFVAI